MAAATPTSGRRSGIEGDTSVELNHDFAALAENDSFFFMHNCILSCVEEENPYNAERDLFSVIMNHWALHFMFALYIPFPG